MSSRRHAIWMNEGSFLDDAGVQITTTFVDLRNADERTPIQTLVKACERQYALETFPTLRITKPRLFRESGSGLVHDENEGKASTNTTLYERTDHPDDLREANARDQETMRAAKLAGSRYDIKRRTTSTKRTRSKGRSINYGNDWWVFSTAMFTPDDPPSPDWLHALDPKYNHVSWIYRPRTFAQSLGAMAAEHLGPGPDESEITHTLNGETRVSSHRFLWVIHGPALYVDDPYKTLHTWSDHSTLMLAMIFVKQRRTYAPQREYRFAIFAGQRQSTTIDLPISPALRSTLEKGAPSTRSPLSLLTSSDGTPENPPGLRRVEGAVHHDTERKVPAVEQHHSNVERIADSFLFWDSSSDPSVPTRPDKLAWAETLRSADGMTEWLSWLTVLGNCVEKVRDKHRLEAASAAWHARQPIHDLLQEYEDPIKNVRIEDSVFVSIRLALPRQSKSEASLVVGPRGCFVLSIRWGGTETMLDGERWPGKTAIEDLSTHGLALRRNDNES